LYLGKQSFTVKGEIKVFHYKENQKGIMIIKPVLQKILRRTLHIEKGEKFNHENKEKSKSH
jgi:bifunctional DNA-binding transcriptional regulator/antitoxin component of YhaV-PrlF toxin-antitoxin module